MASHNASNVQISPSTWISVIVAMLAACGLWLMSTTMIGTVAGGIFGGFLLGTPFHRLFGTRGIVKEIAGPLPLLIGLGLTLLKDELMGPHWEPTPAMNYCGPVIALVVASVVMWVFEDPVERDNVTVDNAPPTTAHEADGGAQQDSNPSSKERVHSAGSVAVGLGLVFVSLAIFATSVAPTLIGTVDQAVGKFVQVEIKRYRDKHGLAYALAGYTKVGLIDKSIRGGEGEVSLRVEVPILPSEMKKLDIHSRSALVAWLDDSAKKSVVVVEGKVYVRRNVFGWVVDGHELKHMINQADEMVALGQIPEDRIRPLDVFSPNIMGIEDMATGSMSVVLTLGLILVASAVFLATGRVLLLFALPFVVSFLSMAPLLMLWINGLSS